MEVGGEVVFVRFSVGVNRLAVIDETVWVVKPFGDRWLNCPGLIGDLPATTEIKNETR